MAIELKQSRLYIDGEWVEASSDDELAVVNPATEEVIARVPQASVADIDRGSRGGAARPSTRARGRACRRVSVPTCSCASSQAVIDRRAELVDLIVAEAGRARPFAMALQFDTPLRYAAWFAERAASFPFLEPLPPQSSPRGLGQGVILKEPIGVVAAITPFNFPLYLNLVKIVPAIGRRQLRGAQALAHDAARGVRAR